MDRLRHRLPIWRGAVVDAAPPQIADGLVLGKGVAEWVGSVLGISFNLNSAEGIGWAKDGSIVMGAAFTDFNGASINMHIALVKGERFTPTFVAAMLDYPFNQAGVKRITGLVNEHNRASRRFAEHLGAAQEGILRDAAPNGNLVVYGLLKADARKWLTASYSQRLRAGGSNGRTVQG